MTSPGGPARVAGRVPGAAGTDRSVEGTPEPPVPPVAGESLRPVPDPPAEAGGDPDREGPADGVPDPGGPRGGAPADVAEGWSGTGPDTGTLRRSRPSRSARSATGVPTPPSPMSVTARPAAEAPPDAPPSPELGPATGPVPGVVADPPRRPVPPTFPSPGQPPPGVARRQGRHAKPESGSAPVHTPPSGYRPRHAAPDAETERFAATPVTGPGGVGPAPLAPAPAGTPAPGPDAVDGAATTDNTPTAAALAPALHTGPGVVVPPLPGAVDGGDVEGAHGDRVRVVLAERRVPTRAVRTVAEIEQQTETGELLLRNLLRAQLALGLRLGLVAVFVLGALPVLFLVLPRSGTVEVAGVTLPWLVLGLVPYPFMLALAWLYTRTAENNERDFADNVED